MLYTLAASLGSPTITMGTLMAFISTLTASTSTFMASTTLTRPTLILPGPCKHSHSSATVSRPLVALSRAIQALPLHLQHFYGLYMQSHRLSCEILSTFLQNIYFYCSYGTTKFLKGHERAFRGHESAFRGRGSAFIGRESVCRGLCDVNKIETKAQTFRYRS